ncbi:hypothetical protein [Saccharothrix lopnurensis]|uniref:Uncharacterized protein n=1 Tax=Saccharothrix lopnurensis TaxID=1670621 RepID=A0ABW1P6Q6_9PSEU
MTGPVTGPVSGPVSGPANSGTGAANPDPRPGGPDPRPGEPDLPPGRPSPNPGERIELRPGLPGWVLRAAIALTCGAVAAVLAAVGVESPALALYLAIAVAAAAIPTTAAAALLIGYPAVAVVFATDGPSWPAVLALVVLLHLVHVLCAYAAVLPLHSRIHPEALGAPARRFALVQLSVFALAGLVTLLPARRTDAPVELIGLACAVGLVLVTVLLLRRRS